jgi:hypothetical protein
MEIVKKELTAVDPPHEYIGASTDTKPTENVPAFSTFFESDLKKNYVFDGTNWLEK